MDYAPGAKNGPAPGVIYFKLAYIGKNMKKKVISETTRPRALIFGMIHYVVVFYQDCSNCTPWAKNGPYPGVTCFT